MRALSRLDDTPAPARRDDDFAPRLSQWLDWTQAIALAGTLAEAPPACPCLPDSRAVELELAQVRSQLAQRIADSCAGLADGFAALRQQVLACQLAMQTQIGPLRRRARATLAHGPRAQLAQIDAVMEQALAPHERSLLADAVQRLQPRHRSQPGGFAQELQALLLAELDLRLQPVEGLIEACRPTSVESA